MMWIIVLGVLLMFFLTYVCLEIYRETHTFVVTRYKIETEKLPKKMQELKIAFLSDFHNHAYGEQSCKLVEAIRREEPDLILIGGDMLVGKKGHSYENAVELIRQLPSIAPVYYANGNHEQRMHEKKAIYGDVYWEYKKTLEKDGVHFLVNESVFWKTEEGKIQLAGLEIPGESYQRGACYPLQKEEIEEKIGTAGDGYTILLAHHPRYAECYWEWGADLVLAGHLHGGVVRLPYLGGIVSPQVNLFPYYSGDCYEKNDKAIIVSKGLGTHTINIRLWNPAELIILSLEGK